MEDRYDWRAVRLFKYLADTGKVDQEQIGSKTLATDPKKARIILGKMLTNNLVHIQVGVFEK